MKATNKINLFLLIFSSIVSVANSPDSLWYNFNNSTHDTLRMKELIKIGEFYENTNPDSALYVYKKLHSLATDNKNKYYESVSLKSQGYVYINTGEFDKAIAVFNESLLIDTELNDSLSVAQCYNNIGVIYDITGKYDQALTYYQKSLAIKERFGDKKSIAFCYTNIGIIHAIQKNYSNALEYFNRALKNFEDIGYPKGIISCLMNIGASNLSIRNNYQALNYFEKAVQFLKNFEEPKTLSACYSNIGKIYENLKDFKKSLDYFSKAMKIKEKISDNSELAGLYVNIARNYMFLQKNDSAFFYTNKGLVLAQKTGILSAENSAYDVYSKLYENSGDMKNSIKYLKLFIETNDSLFNSEKTKQLTEMETKYQTEKKEKEIELLNKDKALQNQEIQKQTILRNSFIAGFVFLLLAVIFIYRNFRNKKKANLLLSAKNAEIQQQKEEIETQAEFLENINKELEKLSIVASETDNAVVISRPDGEIEWVNDGFVRMYEYTQEEFINQFGSNIKKSSKNNDIETAIKTCIESKHTVTYDTLNQTKSGKKIWTQTTLTPIIKDEKLLKLVAIDTDITKLKLAEEAIQQQKEELETQSELLLQTNTELEKKNTQITDSIRYAKQIQDAILPSTELIKQYFSETFILFKPKDIVSGDFFWFTKTEEYIFAAVADCTGHGVPGAFMSMIGNTLLNEIIIQKKIYSLNKIFQKLDDGIQLSLLKQKSEEQGRDDGMEISLIRIDAETKEVQIANTNQTIFLFQENELKEIEGSLFSIGGSMSHEKKLNVTELQYSSGSKIYLFSDGFQDQFGGENKKKYGSARLKELLVATQEEPIEIQRKKIENAFLDWMGNCKQIDDVTLWVIQLP